jgi:small subunit ribosomal protein S6
MRRYETIFIIRPNVAEDNITAIIDRNTGIIVDDFSGIMLTIDKWGLKKLAYNIKKEQQGYYVYIQYAGLPAAVTEMERLLRIDDKVLKYMTIKLQDQFIPDPEIDEEETDKPAGEEADKPAGEENDRPAGEENDKPDDSKETGETDSEELGKADDADADSDAGDE